MADHNMVKDREADEEWGTQAEARLSGEGGMVDAYRATHKQGARGFTHRVRRIDRAAATPSLMERGSLPRAEGAEHVAQDQMEIAVHTTEGWVVKRPHHKAVDLTLRFSEEKREAGGGWVAGAKEAYPEEVWARAMRAMKEELGRRVQVDLGWGGGVEGGQAAVREVLEAHEKKERK